jgi:hypothetical protein
MPTIVKKDDVIIGSKIILKKPFDSPLNRGKFIPKMLPVMPCRLFFS